MVATIALVTHENILRGLQTHTAPLALVALPLELVGLDVLDELGTVLKAVGVGLGTTVSTAEELVELTERVGVLRSEAEAARPVLAVVVAYVGFLDGLDVDDLLGCVGWSDTKSFEDLK